VDLVAAGQEHDAVIRLGGACASPPPHCERGKESRSGPGGLTREVETPLPSNSPRAHMVLRVDLVDSHARWKRPRLQTAHMTI
jgi:hypothetical protein